MPRSRDKLLALIGARSGSTRLPGKNKAELAGRPLYAWTVAAAVDSGLFDQIVFSTDDEGILAGLAEWPQVTADRRPTELADGQTSMWQVGQYVIDRYARAEALPEAICFLTPCHPFRRAEHIIQARQRMVELRAQAVVSVTEYPCPPDLALDLDQGGLIRRNWSGLVRAADHPVRFYPNGAVIIIDTQSFLADPTPYTDRTAGYALAWPDCLDIDYPADLALARRLAPVLLPGAGEGGYGG